MQGGDDEGVKENIKEKLAKEAEGKGGFDESDNEEDPIVAEYDVFIKPQLEQGREVYVLQFPNRDEKKPYDVENSCAPTQFRVKPKSGMVELDVPINTTENYDREKGVKWGQAVKNGVDQSKGSGAYGLAGGFGNGAASRAGGRGGRARAETVELEPGPISDREFESAKARGDVLAVQTLGGQIEEAESWSPRYMLGTFLQNQLHLTPVDHIVQLRPQFHHIDAHLEQERLGRVSNIAQTRISEARAVQMTIKNPVDGESETGLSMAQRVAEVQAEPWKLYKWVDENSEQAWEEYTHLLLGEGKIKPDQLKNTLPQLKSTLTSDEYLDMISAPLDAAKVSRAKVVMRAKSNGKAKGKGKAKSSADGRDIDSSDDYSDIDDAVQNGGDGKVSDLYTS
ncbi:Sin-like protein conserved region-domain-containing protein [Bisporella sp. PMI_857]|nr:Sin-like protein conserved region-domain-containing protein [Bisporella sp. PMI_857]